MMTSLLFHIASSIFISIGIHFAVEKIRPYFKKDDDIAGAIIASWMLGFVSFFVIFYIILSFSKLTGTPLEF